MGPLMRYWQAFPRTKPLLLVYRLTLRLHLASPSDRVVVGQPDQEARASSRDLFGNGGAGGEASCRGAGCPHSLLFSQKGGVILHQAFSVKFMGVPIRG